MGAAKQIDSKGRLLLGSEFAGTTFLMETQKDGSLLLRPAVTVPVETAWFFKNAKAQKLVKAGLEEAASGKLKKINLASDAKLVAKLDDNE
jgi:hypothetical protein